MKQDQLEHLKLQFVNRGEDLLLLEDRVHLLSLAEYVQQLDAEFFQLRRCFVVILFHLLGQLYAEI